MKNREKYKDKIEAEPKITGFCDNFIIPKVLKPKGVSCSNLNCNQCHMIQMLWLDEEYKEPEIDWSKVEVDTPILVKNYEASSWQRAYFADYENGNVFAWDAGATSWSCESNEFNSSPWEFAKLAEVK